MKMVTEKPAGIPGFSAQMCIDAATDRDLFDFGLKMSKDSCRRYEVKRTGSAWIIDAVHQSLPALRLHLPPNGLSTSARRRGS